MPIWYLIVWVVFIFICGIAYYMENEIDSDMPVAFAYCIGIGFIWPLILFYLIFKYVIILSKKILKGKDNRK